MRIVIDARPLSHPQAGGYRSYTRALVQGLAELAPRDIEVLLYLDRPIETPLPFETRVLSRSRLKVDFWHFAQQARRDRPDIIHGTVNYLPRGLPGKSTLLLYDALLVKRYSWESKVKRTLRQRLLNGYWAALMRHSARTATRVFTLSRGAALELTSVLGGAPERFPVIPIGLTLPLPTPGLARQHNTVLAIAAPDPRKNLPALYAALRQLGRGAPALELVCSSAWAAERAKAETRSHGLLGVRFLLGLDNQALADTYARATVFAFPSWQEGFGLPPLEAMQSGCPVVASCAAPMPEILGDAPLYAPPHSPDQLAQALRTLLTSPSEQERRAELGRAQAARYPLRAMAEQTVALWREVAA